MNVNASLRSANTGSVDFVKRAMLANSFMNTTSGECQSVGGSRNMDIVPQATNVCMRTQKNAELSVRTIIEGSANSVSGYAFTPICPL